MVCECATKYIVTYLYVEHRFYSAHMELLQRRQINERARLPTNQPTLKNKTKCDPFSNLHNKTLSICMCVCGWVFSLSITNSATKRTLNGIAHYGSDTKIDTHSYNGLRYVQQTLRANELSLYMDL